VNTHVPSIPAGGPTIAIVVLASVWVAVRDWPMRADYLVLPTVVGIAFVATASGGGPLSPNLTLVTLFITIGTSMVPIGVLDHLLLVRLIKEVRETEAVTESH
jgi:hypothetical protein